MGKHSNAKGENMEGYSFGKRNILMLDMKESRDGFFRRERGKSFHVKWPKIHKAWEPTVEVCYKEPGG